jgi:hypothetical protein
VKFSDWLTEYNKNAERVKDCITSATEMLSLDGKTIVFAIGKGAAVYVDRDKYEPKLLRTSYTNNKSAFDTVLENLKEKASVMEEAMAAYLSAITDSMVPEAVFKRIKGDASIQGDSISLLTEAVKTQLEKIHRNVRAGGPTFFGVIQFACQVPIAEESLVINVDGSYLKLVWNGMAVAGGVGVEPKADLGHCEVPALLLFIQNCAKIEAVTKKVVEHLAAISGVLATEYDK